MVRWGNRDYVVAAAKAGSTLLRGLAHDEVVWVDLVALASDPSFEVLAAPLGDGTPPVDRLALLTMTPEEQKSALWWRNHLFEVEFGVTNPHEPDSRPRPGYDNPKITERRALKAHELMVAGTAVDDRTLRRKWKNYNEQGLAGLLDKRATGKRPKRTDPRVLQAIDVVLARTTQQSTVSGEQLIDRIRYTVEEMYPGQDVPVPSNSTLRRDLKERDPYGRATGDATTRRTEANTPDRLFRPLTAYYPGQVVEIDSTPVNVEVKMPDGKVGRPHLTAMVDVATRSVLGWLFHLEAPSAFDHTLLLAYVMRPRPARRGSPAHHLLANSPSLPGQVMTSLGCAESKSLALPFIQPELVTMDGGKDFRGSVALEAFRLFGISVVLAPPYSPNAKAHVERFFGTVETMWMQYQAHYIGNSVQHRGREMAGEILNWDELEASFTDWVVTVYQNAPHDGLRDREHPGRKFTPNQMYAALFDASCGIPMPISTDTYVRLMPHTTRLVRSDGVQMHNELYDAEGLDPMRRSRKKVEVRWDPYDSDVIWVLCEETGEFVAAAARSVRLRTLPFGDQASRRLEGTDQAANPQREWAKAEVAKTHQKKRKSRKAVGVAKAREEHGDVVPVAPAPTPLPRPTNTSTYDFSVGVDGEELWGA